MLDTEKIRYALVKVLAVVLVFSAGIYIGFNKQPETSKAAGMFEKDAGEKDVDLSNFWKVWDLIDEKYPGAEKVSDEDRIYGAINGLLNSLEDPYSVFLPPDDAKSFEEDISGNFIGVGMEVGIKDKILTVVSPLKSTPAEKAGVKPGDKILKIDGTSTEGLTVEKAVKLIRGDKGTVVTITIRREGESANRDIKITRDVIKVPTLETELRSDGVFVVRLFNFSATSANLFRNSMKEFSKAKTDKLLIDLRGNPGGYLNAAVDISSWFLPSSKIVVTEDTGKEGEKKEFRSKGYNIFSEKLKLVILIDGGSASASEIMAGALQDYGLAKLVGEQSFGKGSVQEVVRLSGGTLLKITIAKWLTPNGVSISDKGLTPDYVVPLTTKDAEAKKDPQLDKAVELLKNWDK